MSLASRSSGVIEVFADVSCPFAHVGLRRTVEHRRRLGREDVVLRVRSWPLEIVNGEPMDGAFVGEEVDEIRSQVAPELFAGFDASAFPATSVPALALTAAADDISFAVGEAVALELRELLFERGQDVSDREVLAAVANRHGIAGFGEDLDAMIRRVQADRTEGESRGVVGSPHFFVGEESYFCPALKIDRDDHGHLHIEVDSAGWDAFLTVAFS